MTFVQTASAPPRLAALLRRCVPVWLRLCSLRGRFPQFYHAKSWGSGRSRWARWSPSREIPGLLAVGIAAIVAHFAEARIGALCLCFSALGVAATGFVHAFGQLVLVTVFWSVFMHQWFTSSSAIPLALAAGQDSGRHLGRMGAVGAAATILAFLLVRPLAGHVPYPAFFVTAALFIFAGGLCLLPMSGASTTHNRLRLLYRREYRLYYGLTFLEGCRRQIFSTFALFALVQAYRVSLDADRGFDAHQCRRVVPGCRPGRAAD